MNIHAKFPSVAGHPKGPMTIEEFLAFTETCPDGEKWELIEGEPVLNASPTDYHQMVVLNLAEQLRSEKSRLKASWNPILGIGTRVPASLKSLPQPDIFVKETALTGSSTTDDALVLFEVLSKSNTKADQAWRRKVYASIPNCQHYVTISMKTVEVVAFDKATDWKPRNSSVLVDVLSLPAVGVHLPLAGIYQGTNLAAP
jgi:Uma2 family endonuclease